MSNTDQRADPVSLSKDALKRALAAIRGGIGAVAKECNLTHEGVRRWTIKGLPRTEWTGETEYSMKIASMQDEVTVDELLGRVRRAA